MIRSLEPLMVSHYRVVIALFLFSVTRNIFVNEFSCFLFRSIRDKYTYVLVMPPHYTLLQREKVWFFFLLTNIYAQLHHMNFSRKVFISLWRFKRDNFQQLKDNAINTENSYFNCVIPLKKISIPFPVSASSFLSFFLSWWFVSQVFLVLNVQNTSIRV